MVLRLLPILLSMSCGWSDSAPAPAASALKGEGGRPLLTRIEVAPLTEAEGAAIYTWSTPPREDVLRIDLGDGEGEINDRGQGYDRIAGDGVYVGKVPFRSADHARRRADYLASVDKGARVMGFEGVEVVDARPFSAALLSPPGQAELAGVKGSKPTVVLFPSVDEDQLAGLSGLPSAMRVERTLTVTDPRVVRDPIRTGVWEMVGNQCVQNGDPSGPWGIVSLMEGIGGGHLSAHDMVMSWLRSYAVTRTVNGQSIDATPQGILDLIEGNTNFSVPVPWPKLVDDGNPMTFNDVMDLSQMPVQLIAIVNRPDLAVAGYNDPTPRAELRFVFTFINEEDCRPAPGTFILEFDTPTPDCATTESWFQQWNDLDTFAPGTVDYNSALEQITTQVTALGAGPGRPNDSMLKVLRVNEQNIVHAHYLNNFPVANGAPWVMQQLSVDPGTHAFVDNTLTLTPAWSYEMVDYNLPAPRYQLINDFIATFTGDIVAGTYDIDLTDPLSGDPFRAAAVLYGRFTAFSFTLPYSPGTGDPAQSGEMTRMTTFGSHTLDAAYIEARKRLSTNTCSGCHYGETFEDTDYPGEFTAQHEGASTPGGVLEQPFQHVRPDNTLSNPAHLSRFLTGTNADCAGAEFVAPLGPLPACAVPGCCPIGDPVYGYRESQVHFNDHARRGQILQDVVTNGCAVLAGHAAADVIVSAAH